MPIKTDCSTALHVHGRAKNLLRNNNSKPKKLIQDNANNITNDLHMHFYTNALFKLIDKIAPLINKYPRIGKLIMLTGEKLIKVSEDFNKNL